MTVFDQERLTNHTLKLDVEGLRGGYYSDKYFVNVLSILEGLRATDYTFAGKSTRDLPIDPSTVKVGDIEVEGQIFNRRLPHAVVAGIDVALAMIRHAAGHFEGEVFVEGWQDLEVVAVHDGVTTYYNGEPNDVETVIEIRGLYRDFALLETPILGVLTRATRIATNVYEALQVASGKQVLFFPARFDLPEVQALDGYAYWLAVQRFNAETQHRLVPIVSTDAQASWWGDKVAGLSLMRS